MPREQSFLEKVPPEGHAVPRDEGVTAGLEIDARLGDEMGRDAAAIAESILLRNDDGSFSPMDEPYFRSELVAPGTWRVLSAGDYSYLVEGEKDAVSIDTGYGAGNIRRYLQSLTDKPVKNVINTHSHFDHTANNGYFESAYMAQAGVPLATVPYKSFEGISFIQDYRRVPVSEGFIYDLGGRTLEVFDIPDHTGDGIALLDRRERLLFTGDEFMVMGKMLNVSVTTFAGYLKKLMAHRGEFDRLCAGGGMGKKSVAKAPKAVMERAGAGKASADDQARQNGISNVNHDEPASPESKYIGIAIPEASQELCDRADPATYASERMYPMLVQHGTADKLVPYEQSVEFVEALKAKGLGGRVRFVPLPGANHTV